MQLVEILGDANYDLCFHMGLEGNQELVGSSACKGCIWTPPNIAKNIATQFVVRVKEKYVTVAGIMAFLQYRLKM